MFNKVQNFITTSPETINIHEHKAPTDKSIDLATEMFEKVKSKLVLSKEFNNELGVNGGVYVFYNLYEHAYDMHITFSLNGKKYSFKKEIDNYDRYTKNENELIELLYKSIAEQITQELLIKNVTALKVLEG